jgi:hypothetical protein
VDLNVCQISTKIQLSFGTPPLSSNNFTTVDASCTIALLALCARSYTFTPISYPNQNFKNTNEFLVRPSTTILQIAYRSLEFLTRDSSAQSRAGCHEPSRLVMQNFHSIFSFCHKTIDKKKHFTGVASFKQGLLFFIHISRNNKLRVLPSKVMRFIISNFISSTVGQHTQYTE